MSTYDSASIGGTSNLVGRYSSREWCYYFLKEEDRVIAKIYKEHEIWGVFNWSPSAKEIEAVPLDYRTSPEKIIQWLVSKESYLVPVVINARVVFHTCNYNGLFRVLITFFDSLDDHANYFAKKRLWGLCEDILDYTNSEQCADLELQTLALERLKILFSVDKLHGGMHDNQYNRMIKLERKISSIIASYVERCRDENILELTLCVYEEILEYLWKFAWSYPNPEIVNKMIKLIDDRAKLFSKINDPFPSALNTPKDCSSALLQDVKSYLSKRQIPKFIILNSIYYNIGAIYDPLDSRCSWEMHKKGLESIKDEQDFKCLKSRSYMGIGNALLDLGKYSEAFEAFEMGLKELSFYCPDKENFFGLDHMQLKGGCFAGKGSALLGLGDVKNAIENHEFHLKISQERRDKLEKAKAYLNLANAYEALGKFKKMIDCGKEIIDISLSINDYDQEVSGNLVTGNAYFYLREMPEALEYLQKAISIARSKNDLKGLADGLGSIGNVYNYLEDFVSAINCFEAQIDIQNKKGFQFNAGIANANLGISYLLLEDYEKAIKYFRNSLEIGESLENYEIQFQALHGLGCVYKEKESFIKAKKYINRAIQILDKKKVGVNKDWRISSFNLLAKPQIVLEQIFLQDKNFQDALISSDSRRSSVLTQNLRKTYPIAALSEQSPSVQQIQQLALQQNTTFIVYSLSNTIKQQLATWVVPSKGEIQYQSLPAELLAQDRGGFNELLTKIPFERKRGKKIIIPSLGDLSTRGGESDSPARRAARRRFVKQKLIKWHKILIAPIEKYLPKDPNQTVTIIPDGFLAQLPFAAFQGKDGKFLIEKHPISIAPSIKTLQLLDEIRNRRELNPLKESLIIGNPLVPNMDPLTIGQEEAEDIGKLLGVDKKNILIQERATVPRFLEKALNARYVFAACHGEADCKPEFDPHSVFEGQLKLAPNEEYPSGNLHSQQISSLNLSAELVFLSACYSGTGKVEQEGTIGNVWSFLAAGALSTIATYWPLPETEATRRMVTRFFHHVLGAKGFSKLNKAQALQQAMLLGMKENRDHFDQWGAFYLSGLN